tara:strand:- start:85 stop:705 length:621 start_codon:yes stop_codon:yes gene_type:complete
MKILAHRGLWNNSEEQNSLLSFKNAVDKNFGIELDVRDFNSKIVISHDIPSKNNMSLKEALKIFENKKVDVAVNVKSDGILDDICEILSDAICNWYLFDMSFPETIRCKEKLIPFFYRISDFEKDTDIIEYASGIWLDSFYKNWFSAELISSYLNNQKKVCVVSSELHSRDHSELWNILRPLSDDNNLSLCTDFPEEAKNFFNETE